MWACDREISVNLVTRSLAKISHHFAKTYE